MAKPKTKEEAKEAVKAAKEELSVAKQELKAFEKENKLAKGEDHSEHEKHGKRWGKLKAVVTKKESALATAEEDLKGLKSEGAGRASKYDYPADCTTAKDKKAYRTKMRAEKNKKDKPAKEKKEKAPKEEAATEKKSKKEKKAEKKAKAKAEVAETED